MEQAQRVIPIRVCCRAVYQAGSVNSSMKSPVPHMGELLIQRRSHAIQTPVLNRPEGPAASEPLTARSSASGIVPCWEAPGMGRTRPACQTRVFKNREVHAVHRRGIAT